MPFGTGPWSLSELMAFAVLLLVVIKQRCITAGAPFWIGGGLPVFVVRPHAPNRDVHTVMVRYEYMYRSTPIGHVYRPVSQDNVRVGRPEHKALFAHRKCLEVPDPLDGSERG